MQWRTELQARYPKIFSEPCGIWCGRGWETLVDVLCEALRARIDATGEPQLAALEVKEKFGELRFYFRRLGPVDEPLSPRRVTVREHAYATTISSTDESAAEGLIDLARRLSLRTCDVCGAPGRQRQNRDGFVATRCVGHTKARPLE